VAWVQNAGGVAALGIHLVRRPGLSTAKQATFRAVKRNPFVVLCIVLYAPFIPSACLLYLAISGHRRIAKMAPFGGDRRQTAAISC